MMELSQAMIDLLGRLHMGADDVVGLTTETELVETAPKRAADGELYCQFAPTGYNTIEVVYADGTVVRAGYYRDIEENFLRRESDYRPIDHRLRTTN